MSGTPLVQRPLILIGAGRSGSTLLTNILNNQKEISFHGETGFLAPRLWDEAWVDQFWYQWRDSALKKQNQQARSFFQVAANRDRASPNAAKNAKRAGRLLAELFFDLIGAESSEHWGFKEPWLGHPNFDYAWDGYDALFPQAVWLHLVRNPFDFARSSAQWNRETFDEAYLKRRLFEWGLMTRKCRERKSTGRYYEVRFEDLIVEPERALSDLFDHLAIAWNPDNAEILKTKYIASSDQNLKLTETLLADGVGIVANQVDGLRSELERCGYSPPEMLQFSQPVLSADESAQQENSRSLVARSPRAFMDRRIQDMEHKLDQSRVGRAIEYRIRRLAERIPKLPGYASNVLWSGLGGYRWLLSEEPRTLSPIQRIERRALDGLLSAPDAFYRRVFARFDRSLQGHSGALSGGRHEPGRVHFMIGSLQPGGAERQAALTLAALARHGTEKIRLTCMWLHEDQHRFFLSRLDDWSISVDVIADHSVEKLAPALLDAFACLPASLGDVAAFAAAIADKKPGVAHLWLDEVNIKGGIAAVALGVPRVILSSRNLPPNHFQLHKPYMREAYRWLLRQTGVELINNSEAGARGYEAWLGLPRNSVRVIRNGIEPGDESSASDRPVPGVFREKFGIAKTAPLIGGIFRLQEEKRPLLFLEIAAEIRKRMPDAAFLIVGDGPMRALLENRSRRVDLDNAVHFAGHEHDIQGVFADIDLCLLASRGEGLPNVLIEAQAMGVPVVTTPAGGAPETVDHGRTGIVLENDDSEIAAQTIVALMRDDVWMANARKAAPEFVMRNFALETAIDETLALYGSTEETKHPTGRRSRN
jgi:glycosyltransferase involved in cell wall biosynthesis